MKRICTHLLHTNLFAPQVQTLDDILITGEVLLPQVRQKSTALADQFQQSAPGGLIVLVDL